MCLCEGETKRIEERESNRKKKSLKHEYFSKIIERESIRNRERNIRDNMRQCEKTAPNRTGIYIMQNTMVVGRGGGGIEENYIKTQYISLKPYLRDHGECLPFLLGQSRLPRHSYLTP